MQAIPLQKQELSTLHVRRDVSSIFLNFPCQILKKGEIVIHPGRSQQYIFLIEEGVVKTLSYYPRYQKEIVSNYYKPNDLVNLHFLQNNAAQSDKLIVASRKARIKKIPISAFKELMLQKRELLTHVIKVISRQHQKQQDRLHRLIMMKSHERIIHFLLDFVKDTGKRVGYEYVFKPVFTHEVMGSLTDTSRQTVTTVLNDLRKKGLVHFTRRYFIIRDLEALENLLTE